MASLRRSADPLDRFHNGDDRDEQADRDVLNVGLDAGDSRFHWMLVDLVVEDRGAGFVPTHEGHFRVRSMRKEYLRVKDEIPRFFASRKYEEMPQNTGNCACVGFCGFS